MDARLRALCDMSVPDARESAGRHEYDGEIQDLSIAGVARGLAALGGPPDDDPYDELLLGAKESECRVVFADLELHRRIPLLHATNLDLACYDREYAPPAERAAARARHLARWPDGVQAAIGALDQVTAPVADATLGGLRGLAAGLRPGANAAEDAALAAHARLVAHVEAAAESGPPEAALGAGPLARLLAVSEAMPVDLTELAARAEVERDRLRAWLDDSCARLEPGRPTGEVVAGLLADHPDAAGVITEAQTLTDEVLAWTAETGLAPYSDGVCRVGPAPAARQWATAMMSWAAPGEPDAPSWYYVTPPDPDWSESDQAAWLSMFSRATLPAITVHEVAPGHYSHGRALRRAATEARRTLLSEAFAEGWAHYVEEVAVEEGFRGDDPRFAIGVALEALVRVTRLSCSIGVHSGEMTIADATGRFEREAFLTGPAALAEARRSTFDPTYGRYTWGKLAIQALREQARATWAGGFSLPRFHAAMLALGSPPLGLLGHALAGAPGPIRADESGGSGGSVPDLDRLHR